MALHKHNLGETFDSPSTHKTKFFPSVTIPAAIGDPGTNVQGNFSGRITGVNVDEKNKTRTTVEVRSMGLDQSEHGRRKKATSSVAALLRKQGHFA